MAAAVPPLSLTAFPPAIDISTPANPQVFGLQLFLANTSRPTQGNPGETVTVQSALLLVPVNVQGAINLAASDAMTPGVSGAGWSLKPVNFPNPAFAGFAQFELLPSAGGALLPGGSIAFSLSGIQVATTSGAASLQLIVNTADGQWQTSVPVDLTEPTETPVFHQPWGVTPANLLRGQSVVISWTSSGAAYCTIEDDLGHMLINPNGDPQFPTHFPTSGTCHDTPQPPSKKKIQNDPVRGRSYQRQYTLTAYSSGAQQSTQINVDAYVWLPTVLDFSVTPASIELGQAVTAAWSVVNVDPNLGSITLSMAPTDGTGVHTIAIPPDQATGSGVVTPTPLTNTTYTLDLDNGYGATESSTPVPITGLSAGWTEMTGLETLPAPPSIPIVPLNMCTLAGRLWCCYGSALYWTVDGARRTLAAANPPNDGMVVADLGHGARLWVFGVDTFLNRPFTASSADGEHWDIALPSYPPRTSAQYAVTKAGLVVLGGMVLGGTSGMTDVWTSADGIAWTQTGTQYPAPYSPLSGTFPAAAFAGKLTTIGGDETNNTHAYWSASSSDGGATWVKQALPSPLGMGCTLQPLAQDMWLLGAGTRGGLPIWGLSILDMNPSGTWTLLSSPQLPSALSSPSTDRLSSAVYAGCLWLAVWSANPFSTPRFFLLNQVLPGTAFTLVPAAGE